MISLKREGKLLVAFATLSSLGVSMILPYIPVFGKEVGMPIWLVGYLVFAYYGIEVITRIPIGLLSDIFSYTIVVLAGAISFLTASIFYLTSSAGWYFILLAQVFLGLGISITWVTIPSLITILESSLSVYTFSVGLGWLVGPLIGGFVKGNFSMYTLFLVFSMLSIPLVILTLLFVKSVEGSFIPTYSKENPSKFEKTKDSPVVPTSIPQVFSLSAQSFKDAFELLRENRKIAFASLVSFIMFMGFAMVNSLMPLRFDGIGLGSFLIGVLLTLRTGTGTIIRLGTEKILKIGEKVTILIGGTILSGLVVLIISNVSYFPLLVILMMIWGLAGGIYLPVVFSLIADATSESERGVAMGLRGTMGTGGSAIGVLVFMNIAGEFSVSLSLFIFGIFVLVFSAFLVIYWRLTTPQENT